VRRLVTYRGFSESDAKARIASQISNSERSAIVDVVIPNNGTLEEFQSAVSRMIQQRGLGD
jgi:dephospho-CoA kinase